MYSGYGLSSGSPTERRLYRDVAAVYAHVQQLVPTGVRCVMWGRSLGSITSIYMAERACDAGDE